MIGEHGPCKVCGAASEILFQAAGCVTPSCASFRARFAREDADRIAEAFEERGRAAERANLAALGLLDDEHDPF